MISNARWCKRVSGKWYFDKYIFLKFQKQQWEIFDGNELIWLPKNDIYEKQKIM